MEDKGTCKRHGEFILRDGCPQCIAELKTGQPVSVPMKDGKTVLLYRKGKKPQAKKLESKIEVEKSLRYRVNAAISTKGIKTWDCTVDGLNYEMDEVLEKSDELVKKLEERYPAPKGE